MLVNGALCEAVGRRPSDLLGQPVESLFAAASRDPVRVWLDAPDSTRVPIELNLASQPERLVELTASIFETGEGGLLVGLLSDVDHRERLAGSEGWFRTLAETTVAAIIVYDMERILYANRAAEALTGYGSEELLEMSATDLAEDDFAALARERLAPRVRGELPPSHLEFKLKTKQGRAVWVDLTVSGVRFRGAGAALASAIDITERKEVEERIQESRQRLDFAQRAARYIAWEWRTRGGELLVEGDVERIFGFSRQQIGRTMRQFLRRVHRQDRRLLLRQVGLCLRHGVDLEVELRFGEPEIWLDIRARVVLDSFDRVERFMGFARNITQSKLYQEALFYEKERAQVTLASIGDGVIRTDARGRVDFLNPVACRLTGWSLGEAVGRSLEEVFPLVDESTGKALPSPVGACLRTDQQLELPGFSLLLDRQGVETSLQGSVSPVRDRDRRARGAVVVFRDVSELRGIKRRMSYLASHDGLTGLIHRGEFEAHLERALASARLGSEHALCHLDVDAFKVVNDTAGSEAGDELLKLIARLLVATAPSGTVIGRLGSDEFGVLFLNLSPEEGRRRSEDLCRAVADFRFAWRDSVFDLTVSIGLLTLTRDGGDVAQVLSSVDAARHAAKEAGGNRVREYQPDDRLVAARTGEMQWIRRIHKAFEEDRFRLYRQRIEPLGEGVSPLYEIFIRMQTEEQGLASPAAFIPAAERYRMVRSIDCWVVSKALESLERRFEEGAYPEDSRFCINLSGQSLSEESFLPFVVAELERCGLDLSRLCFEITETAAVTHLAQAQHFISVVQGLGCRFVLDDFGSGLSSFAYLKNLPVDYLKVAGEFVRDMTDQRVERALVSAIGQLGKEMGLRTIAEWVEDEQALEAVREMGMDYAQGFLLDKPSPL
ncbi:MAG: EAL domain-containing protein [Acidobacteriota bacterium]